MKHNLLCLRTFCIIAALVCLSTIHTWAASEKNPEAVTAMLNRIGGEGAASRFETVLDASLTSNGKDAFTITSQSGKPCIKGSSVLAITTGINWYLNHYAHINLAWNNLTTDLSQASLPTPTTEEKRTCSADYRYYLNYCTFSYSMATWTWERWQQEIDWMALHGINMPLQIIGVDVVWKKLLTQDLGYSSADANKFIAGPCFQGWFGMNNLEGWGGPNPDWWYTRQEQLAKKILARERELGMQPVLPGYSGMVPSDIESKKGYKAYAQGGWNYFTRPYILDPNSQTFTDVAEKYYQRLKEVMGESEYYSMDPFHEGAQTGDIDVASAYAKIAQAMTKANSTGKWVIQYWQWSYDQNKVLSNVDKGKLIVLDLYSDAHSHFGEYQGHDAVYCALPNFGARTGFFGRLTKVMTDYFTQKANHSNMKGVGATPEGIEQVPVLYDALYELPWYASAPDAKAWLANYTTARYGATNTEAQEAWEKARNSALNCPSSLQGPQEAVLCARPSLTVDRVSSWGGTDIFYNAQDMVDAAYKLLQAKAAISGENFSYDLTDFSRQALTDYANFLLKSINDAATRGDQTAYATRRDAFLQLLLDMDQLLNTNKNFMLGRWTTMARAIADETTGTTESDKQWLELNNARTLITTWGDYNASELGGLRDYSYREWGGMLKDFYYNRWKAFFDNRDKGTALPNWYEHDWNWAHNAKLSYSNQPVGSTAEVATTLFDKYFAILTQADGTPYYLYRYMNTDLTSTFAQKALRGETYTFPLQNVPNGTTASLGIDLNNDGTISANETFSTLSVAIPANAAIGKVAAKFTLNDGTSLDFKVTLKDDIQADRTVSVSSADDQQGSVSIEGSNSLSVTGKDEVTMKATPKGGYDFLNWTDAQGNVVSTDNPYTYYGAAGATFRANFIVNKWGSPEEDRSEIGVVSDYGQYIKQLDMSQNGSSEQTIYSTDVCPQSLCQTSQVMKAAKGSQITLHWTSAGGLNYCNLSAYADWNCDGDFDNANELVATAGKKGTSNNPELNDYTLKVLLPYDVPEGITHIRLRLDGAWAKGYDSNGAMPAKAQAMRMVYDVPVEVTSQASTPCTITVKSADLSKGTVDANGQPETFTYDTGNEIVLRSYPIAGYSVKWTDQYGRAVPKSWIDGNFLRFHAPESGTYTANFQKELPGEITIGNWTFQYTTNDNDELTLIRATSGSGALDIPASYESHPIVGITPEALQGNTKITSISLPSTIKQFAASGAIYAGSYTGKGTENDAIKLSTSLAANKAWSVSFNVENGGQTFNQWGSSLLATGTEALASIYDKGFQLYLAASGNIVLKLGSEEKKVFTLTQGKTSFSVNVVHNAAGDLSVSINNGSETDSYTEKSYELNDVEQFCTALPKGVNLNNLVASFTGVSVNPLKGCTNLQTISVSKENPYFSATDDVLYDAQGTTLLACPAGRLSSFLNLPSKVKAISNEAFSQCRNLRYISCTNATPAVAMAKAFDGCKLYAQVGESNIEAYRKAWGLPILALVSGSDDLADATALKLTSEDAVYLKSAGEEVPTASTLSQDIPVWLSIEMPANVYGSFYFPTVPTGIFVEGIDADEVSESKLNLLRYENGTFTNASEIQNGIYLMSIPEEWSGKSLTLQFPHSEAEWKQLNGAVVNGSTKGANFTARIYVFNEDYTLLKLLDKESTISISPFTAMLTGDDSSAPTINIAALTGIHASNTSTSIQPVSIYDLNGRQISNSKLKSLQRGVYIINGKKVVK